MGHVERMLGGKGGTTRARLLIRFFRCRGLGSDNISHRAFEVTSMRNTSLLGEVFRRIVFVSFSCLPAQSQISSFQPPTCDCGGNMFVADFK